MNLNTKVFDLDEDKNIPMDNILKCIKENNDCVYNCWLCYFNKNGARNYNVQLPDREDVCTIFDHKTNTSIKDKL